MYHFTLTGLNYALLGIYRNYTQKIYTCCWVALKLLLTAAKTIA